MKAALVSVDLDTGEHYATLFKEGDNPCQEAYNLWESIKGDWPTHTMTIITDDEAKKAYGEAQVIRMLGPLEG